MQRTTSIVDGSHLASQACGIRLKRLQESTTKNALQRKKKTTIFVPPTSPIRKPVKKQDLLPSIHSLRLPTSTSERPMLPFIPASTSFLAVDPAHLGTGLPGDRSPLILASALSKLDGKHDAQELKASSSGDSLLFLNFVNTAAMRAQTGFGQQPLNA